jgi:glutamate dehydrogenase
VLADNASQALALTLDGVRTTRHYEDAVSLVADLVGAGILDPVDDAVPTRDELVGSPSRHRGLPRPLLCSMLARVKIWAVAHIVDSPLPDADIVRPLLAEYFPSQMRERFGDQLWRHPLRREIVTTAIVNRLVNQAGVTFIHRVMAKTGAGLSDVAHAYVLADWTSRAEATRALVRAEGLSAANESAQLLQVEERLEQATVRLLRKEPVDLTEVLNGVRAGTSP